MTRLEGGIDADVSTDGVLVWRGQRVAPPSVPTEQLLAALAAGGVVQTPLRSWTCGEWWWIEVEYLPDSLPATAPASWVVLAERLAAWHRLAPPPPPAAPGWYLPPPLDQVGGPHGWCHWDLHEDNLRGRAGEWFIIDCWAPVAGPLNLDLAVACGYAVAGMRSFEAWALTADAYRAAGGPAEVSGVCPLHGIQVVGSYGPPEFTAITDALEAELAAHCSCEGDHERFVHRPWPLSLPWPEPPTPVTSQDQAGVPDAV